MTLSAPTLLLATHDASAFDCGMPALNDWLKRRALANQSTGASRTYVVLDGDKVVGYYAVAAGSIAQSEAPGRVRRNMPDPIPMMLLGRLAADNSVRGRGVGAGLLRDCVLRVVQASDIVGIRGIIVEAIDDTARTFYEKFGFRPSNSFPLKLMITVDEARRILTTGAGRP